MSYMSEHINKSDTAIVFMSDDGVSCLTINDIRQLHQCIKNLKLETNILRKNLHYFESKLEKILEEKL